MQLNQWIHFHNLIILLSQKGNIYEMKHIKYKKGMTDKFDYSDGVPPNYTTKLTFANSGYGTG